MYKIIDQRADGSNGGMKLPSFAKHPLIADQARPFVVVYAIDGGETIARVVQRHPSRKSAERQIRDMAVGGFH